MAMNALLHNRRHLLVAAGVALVAGAAMNLPHWPMARLVSLPGSLVALGLADPLAGDAFSDEPGNPAWLHWQWCPGLNPLRWCVDYESRGLALMALAKPGSGRGLSLEQVRLRMASTALPLRLPDGLSFTLSGSLERIEWPGSGCLPLLHGGAQSSLRLVDLRLAGLALPDHRLELRELSATAQSFSIEGDVLQGSLLIDADGSYAFDALMQAVPGDSGAAGTLRASGMVSCDTGAGA